MHFQSTIPGEELFKEKRASMKQNKVLSQVISE